MTRGVAACLGALLVELVACGGDGGAGTGGGSGGAAASGGGGATSGGVTTTTGSGSPACDADPSGCACCEEVGGVCVPVCPMGFPEGFDCANPEEPPEGHFDCAGVLLCTVAEACVVVAGESACPEHFCEPLPPPCVEDPSCACLAEFLDSELTTKLCEETPGGPRVDLAALGLVWDPPFCDGVVCEAPEICWSCVDGSGMTFACSEDDPLAGDLCTPAR